LSIKTCISKKALEVLLLRHAFGLSLQWQSAVWWWERDSVNRMRALWRELVECRKLIDAALAPEK